VRDAILGNVGSIISFRLGLADAEMLENEFRPEISALDLISLPNYQIYLKLMIQGRVSRVFSAETLRMNSSQTEGIRERTPPAIACHRLPLS
jgi:hypothetical protein